MNDNEAPKPLTLEGIEEARQRVYMAASVMVYRDEFLDLLALAEEALLSRKL